MIPSAGVRFGHVLARLGSWGVFVTVPAWRRSTKSWTSTWPKRTPLDGIIDWETRAPYLYDWVRAQTRPYPGAFTFLGEEKVVVWRARPIEWKGAEPAGTVVDEGPIVACGEGALLLEEVESAAELAVGTRLG